MILDLQSPPTEQEGKVGNLKAVIAFLLLLLEQGRLLMAETMLRYHTRLYQLGVSSGVSIGQQPQTLTNAQIASNINALMEIQQTSSRQWMEDIATRYSALLASQAFTPSALRDFARRVLESQGYRTHNFVSSGWATAHIGARDEMIGQAEGLGEFFETEAIFTAWPEADVIATTCAGCEGAVAGNPYTPESVPMPGEFECLFNCRHEVWYRFKDKPQGG